jgi:serine/threonine protein kinase
MVEATTVGDLHLPAAVAVKELGLETKELEATARRELAVLRTLCSSTSSTCSSSLVRCFGATVDPARNLVTVALELATAGSLRSWLNRRQQQQQPPPQPVGDPNHSTLRHPACRTTPLIDLGVVASVAAHLVAGLSALHAAGYCHGDLTPSNVLLLPWGQVAAGPNLAFAPTGRRLRPIPDASLPGGPWRLVLSDFGLATQAIGSETHIGSGVRAAAGVSCATVPVPCGARCYCSPEAHLSGGSGHAAGDVWALGVMLWEAAARRHPFDLEIEPRLDEEPAAAAARPAATAANDRQEPRADNNDAATKLQPRVPPLRALAAGEDYWATSEALEAVAACVQRHLVLAKARRRSASRATTDALRKDAPNHEGDQVEFWTLVASCLDLRAECRPAAQSAALGPFLLLGYESS